MAIPNYVRARAASQESACINNLRQVDGAIQQYALENKLAASATVTEANVTPYLKSSVTCPAGGTSFADSYTISDCQTEPTCKKVTDGTHALPGTASAAPTPPSGGGTSTPAPTQPVAGGADTTGAPVL
jgi:type II secretory pathway pseudopilin PulG